MALIFPSNPTLNQVFSTGSLSWTWNGKSWNNGTSILVTSNLVSSSVQFTNGNTNAFDTTSNITVGQITASFAKISGSIFGTASFAILAQTSSYLENAQTASYVLNSVSASYSLTSSYVALSQTASYVENAQTASYVTLAQTASYISTASYALAALSASYAPNIYVLPNNVVSSSAQLSNGGGVAFDTNSNITVNQITASFAKITNLTVEYVTSSVMVITGSNKFGDASNDKQEFTGSVNISGSLSIVGNVTSNNVLSLASGTVSLPSLILSTDTTSGMYRIGANNIGIAISAAKVLDISSTGLSVTGALSASGGYNGSVGATTPSTVAATTLAATSDTSSPIATIRNSAAGAAKYTRFSLGNDASATSAELYTFSSTYTPSAWEKPSGMGVFSSGAGGLSLVSQSGDVRILAGSLSTVHGLFTTTGLAVTGALSATGNLTLSAANSNILGGTSTGSSSIFNSTGASGFTIYGPTHATKANQIDVFAGGLGHTFNSTGLAVTGTLAASGTITADSSSSATIKIDRGSTSDYSILKFITAGADADGWEIYTANTADPSLIFYNYTAGSARLVLNDGMVVGPATGSDKGVGTANFFGDIYKNNTAYTNPDYVFEKWATGSIVKFADKEGAKDYDGLKPLAEVEAFAKEKLHLPRFGQNAGHGIFSGSDALLASVEEAYLYIFQQDAELKSLRARVAALESK